MNVTAKLRSIIRENPAVIFDGHDMEEELKEAFPDNDLLVKYLLVPMEKEIVEEIYSSSAIKHSDFEEYVDELSDYMEEEMAQKILKIWAEAMHVTIEDKPEPGKTEPIKPEPKQTKQEENIGHKVVDYTNVTLDNALDMSGMIYHFAGKTKRHIFPNVEIKPAIYIVRSVNTLCVKIYEGNECKEHINLNQGKDETVTTRLRNLKKNVLVEVEGWGEAEWFVDFVEYLS